MRKLIAFATVLGLAVILLPGVASAQSPEEGEGLVLRVSGDVVIATGERVDAVIVIDGDLTVDGTVTDFALVIDGDATVGGSVEGDITVISGDLNLTSTAVVNNVNSIRGDLIRESGAEVTGDVNERDNLEFAWAVAGLISILFWLGITVALVVAALVFARFGARQLSGAASLTTGDFVNSLLGAVFLWVGAPLLAVVAFLTVIGIPLGIGILVFFLPVMGFLGYLVAGTRVGMFLLGLTRREQGGRPYAEAALGVFLLQLLVLVPFAGVVVVVVAAALGAGALAFQVYRGAGGRGFGAEASTESAPATPAP